MKIFSQIILILVIFLQTGNLLSENNLFNVNNILIEKNKSISNKQLANKAINEAFRQLAKKILMKDDLSQVSNLSPSDIKKLVNYYNISKNTEKDNGRDIVSFNISFDKEKIHNLFYKRRISYSDITDKEFYILPILLNGDDIFVFSNNFFYENWNKVNKEELIEFILPLQNIETIQKINQYRNNLFDLELSSLFKEYEEKNIALALIEIKNPVEKKIYLKAKIQNKIISKSLSFKNKNKEKINFNEIIIDEIKNEITDLIKSRNLIDIQTPSFLNVRMNLNKKNNLVLLNSKIKNIDLVENIFVQDFNKDYINVKIKYLGKLENIINQLKKKNINLKLSGDQWFINL